MKQAFILAKDTNDTSNNYVVFYEDEKEIDNLRNDPKWEVRTMELHNDIDWKFFIRYLDARKLKQSQNRGEFDQLIDWLRTELSDKPVSYLEIGSYAGESLYYLAQVFPPKSKFVLYDLGDNSIARNILLDVIPDMIAKYGHEIYLVTGDTLHADAVKSINSVHSSKFDFCFIDANHSFDFALNDYKKFSPLANITFLHDVSRETVERTKIKHGVYKPEVGHFWESLKACVDEKNWKEIKDTTGIDKVRGFGIVFGSKFS